MKPDAFEVVKSEEGYTVLLTPVDMNGETLTEEESVQPLYSEEKIVGLLEDKIDEFNSGRESEYPQKVLKEVIDELEEVKQ